MFSVLSGQQRTLVLQTATTGMKSRSFRFGICAILAGAAIYYLFKVQLYSDKDLAYTVFTSAHIIKNNAIQQKDKSAATDRQPEGAGTYHQALSTLEGLGPVASSIAKEKGVVLFTVINDAYMDFAFSWLCNTAVLESVHQHVLFLATDISTGQRMRKQWPSVHVVSMNDTQGGGALEYSTAGYVRLMVQRTHLIQRLLQQNVRLLLFELDFVWLANPLPTILSQSEKTHSDVVATKVYGTNLACGCFLLLNPTPATKTLWTRLTAKMDTLHKRIAQKGRSVPVAQSDNDQTYLSELINGRYGGIRVSYLSERLFPDGKWYQLSHLQSLKPDPLVIHNNWIAGNHNKIVQAKKFGHWFLINSTDSDSICNVTLVRQLVSNKP